MADEIRQRCWILMQKMTSLRIAVDERMMSFNAMMTSEEGGARPMTSFMRTPLNLSALFDRLAENIAETKHLLEQTIMTTTGGGGADVKTERNQIRALIADLERELNRIAPRLNLHSTKNTGLPGIHSSAASNEPDDKSSCSLPPIVCSSDPTGVPTSATINNTLRPRRRNTKTMLLRMQLARDAATTLKSNQGYPYDSSFPKLEPIHPRRSIRERTRIAGVASDSDLSRTIVESDERQLKTNELLRPRHRYLW